MHTRTHTHTVTNDTHTKELATGSHGLSGVGCYLDDLLYQEGHQHLTVYGLVQSDLSKGEQRGEFTKGKTKKLARRCQCVSLVFSKEGSVCLHVRVCVLVCVRVCV